MNLCEFAARRKVSVLLALAAAGTFFFTSAGDARADCALIDSAARELVSTFGGTTAPWGSPGRELTVVNPVACNPDAGNFAFDPLGDNQVEITFLPRNGSASPPPEVIEGVVPDACNTQNTRCTVLRFTVPTTPYAGPARIIVRNMAVTDDSTTPEDERISAQIDDLYEPTVSCDPANRTLTVFSHFAILPADNVFTEGTGRTVQAAPDGADGLLIPMNWGPVLPPQTLGIAQYRIIQVVSEGGTLLVGPGDVRAYTTDTGQPLPPIIEINDLGSGFGDTVTGSIDFPNSVARISMPLLAAGAGATPLAISGLTFAASAAGPLNSISPAAELIGLARDEALEGDIDGDGLADRRFASFIDRSGGGVVDTNQAVMESSRSPLKPILFAEFDLMAFCRSEAHDRMALSGDNDLEDCIARLFTVDGVDRSAGVNATADPSAEINGPNAFAVGENFAFFLRNEMQEAPFELAHGSPDPGGQFLPAGGGSSGDPSLDGDSVSFRSDAGTALAPMLLPDGGGVVWETADIPVGIAFGITDFLVLNGFSFNEGFEDVPGVDLSACTASEDGLQISFTEAATPTTGTFEAVLFDTQTGGCFAASVAAPAVGNYVVIPGPGGTESDPIVPETMIHAVGPLDVSQLPAPLPPELANLQIAIELEVLTVGLLDFTFQGSFALLADGGGSAGAQQIFRHDFSTGTNSALSVNNLGVASDGDCFAPSAGGGKTAFACDATNLGAADGFRHVYVRDGATTDVVSAGLGASCDQPSMAADGSAVLFACNGDIVLHDLDLGTNSTLAADDGSGASFSPHLNADASCAVWASDNENLVAGESDTNGFTDIYFWDAASGLTERITRLVTAGPTDGSSDQPTVSADCRWVGFLSAATALLAEDLNLNHPVQCYTHDRIKSENGLASITLAGDGSDGACLDPRLAANGQFLTFRADASNLPGGGAGIERTWRANRLTGIVTEISQDTVRTPADASSQGAASLGPDGQTVAFATLAGLLPGDTNDASDVLVRRLGDGPDLDGNDENDDRLLYALAADGSGLVASNAAVSKAATAGDMAAFIQEGTNQIGFFDASGSATTLLPDTVTDIAVSHQVICALSTSGELLIGDPANPGAGLAGQGVQGDAVAAVDGICVVLTPENGADLDGDGSTDDRVLHYVDTLASPPLVNTGRAAVDFQVSSRGIAFRHPEDATDTNGDEDGVDLVMEFWDFQSHRDGDDALIETFRNAIPCAFPGCDPFFEPYRVVGPYLSFVALEENGQNAFGTTSVGKQCLPGAPSRQCDFTGDADNDDFAVVVFSLDARESQIFPVAPEQAGQITETPLASEEGVVTLNGAVCGDQDGDGTLDCDGITNEQFSNLDNCSDLSNPGQEDGDNDGAGEACENDDTNIEDNPGFVTCDLDSPQNGVDPDDIGQIFADRGQAGGTLDAQTGEFFDSRNPDRDPVISVLDARQCAVLCENTEGCAAAQSANWVPPTSSSTGSGNSCGLVGIEALLPIGLAAWVRRRRRNRIEGD